MDNSANMHNRQNKWAMIIAKNDKNDDYYHKGREGGGQKVMIEIIILL